MKYSERILEFAKETQNKMRDVYLREKHLSPDMFRNSKRILYHAVMECGINCSGLASVKKPPKPYNVTTAEFCKDYDLEDEHVDTPEFWSLFLYAHYDVYLVDTKEALDKFTWIFYNLTRTHKVPGHINTELRKTSGKIDRGVIKKRPTCYLGDKYAKLGMDKLYNIKTGEPVNLKQSKWYPDEFAEWEKKYWSGDFTFDIKHEYGTLEEFFG